MIGTNFTLASGSWSLRAQTQWAPSLMLHDPNPPITLENPPWIFAQQPAFCASVPQNVAGQFSPFVPGLMRPFFALSSSTVIWQRPPIYVQQQAKPPPVLTMPWFAQDTSAPLQPCPKPTPPPWSDPKPFVAPVVSVKWLPTCPPVIGASGNVTGQTISPAPPTIKVSLPGGCESRRIFIQRTLYAQAKAEPIPQAPLPLLWFPQDTTPVQPSPRPRLNPWSDPSPLIPPTVPVIPLSWLPSCPPVVRVSGNVIGQTISPAPPTIKVSLPGGCESHPILVQRILYAQSKAEPVSQAPTPISFLWFPPHIPAVVSISRMAQNGFLPRLSLPAPPPGSKPSEFQSRPFQINRVFYAQGLAAPIPIPVPPTYIPWIQRTDPAPVPFPAHKPSDWLSRVQAKTENFPPIVLPPPVWIYQQDGGPDYLATLPAQLLSVQAHAEPIQGFSPPFVREFPQPPKPRPWTFIIAQPTQAFPTPPPPPPPVWEAFADPAPIAQRAPWSWLYLAQPLAEPIQPVVGAAPVWVPYPEPPPPPHISFPWLPAIQSSAFATAILPLWEPPPVIALPPPRPPFLFHLIETFTGPIPNVPAPPAAIWIPYSEPGRPPVMPRPWLFIVQTTTARFGAVAVFHQGKLVFWQIPGGACFFKIPGDPRPFEIPGGSDMTWDV